MSKSKNKKKVPTEMELVLEQTQQGTSYEVLVSAEGVEELERKVKIKGEKKEALLTHRLKLKRFNTTAGNPVKEILLKLNLPDHRSILTDSKVTPTKHGRMTKPYSSPIFIANYFISAIEFIKSIHKKAISEKAKTDEEPEEKHVSPVRSEKGKGYTRSGDQESNVPRAVKKNVVRRKTRSLTVADNIVEDPVTIKLVKSISPIVEDPVVQSLLEFRKGSKASRLESLKQSKQEVGREGLNIDKERDDETDDSNDSHMDLFKDEPKVDDNSLFNETPANELTDFLSNSVYTNAHTTLVVANQEGNPKEMSPDEAAHHISSPPANIQVKDPQPSSLQAKAKTLMQKEKKNMRKINFKGAVEQKFKGYNQKLEALTSINVFEAIDKSVHAKVLTEMKKLIPTHVPKVLANYVNPYLNNSVLEDPPNDREREKRKKRRKDVGWFMKKSRSADAAKRRTIWFDMLLKTNIDQNKNHILRPSTMSIEKKLKELIQKDEKLCQLKHSGNTGEGDASKLISFKSHMSKSIKPHLSFYNNDFYYLVSLSTREKYATSLTKHFTTRYYIQGIKDMISERWSKEVKDKQEKDEIGSKPGKNEKRDEAGRSQK
uniref:Uncharacterized protein n=1 Tax=Tanacetum cinerariifolium TaxID=118510 RepID=A0A699GVH1_TANCI|nr:hypothetical protein [Tanacetum cinerariifolium]